MILTINALNQFVEGAGSFGYPMHGPFPVNIEATGNVKQYNPVAALLQ